MSGFYVEKEKKKANFLIGLNKRAKINPRLQNRVENKIQRRQGMKFREDHKIITPKNLAAMLKRM